MEPLPYGTRPSRSGLSWYPLPETQEAAEFLAASIEQAVQRKTGGNVSDLHVEVRRNQVLLDGRCKSFYTKQRAQHAAMEISGPRQLTNRIEVR